MVWAPTRLTVLAGPSGVGKGTVAALIAERYPKVYLSISATTRRPRPGEVEAVSYFFISRAAFEAAVVAGDMLEWAEYNGHLYGTPRLAVEDALGAGRPALLEIDLAGARQIRQSMPGALQVFLMPPTWKELERRLIARGTEDEGQRLLRLATAEREVRARGEFDFVLTNDDLDRTVTRLAAIMGLD
ncbi:MAG: guanylate kinase [Bifidobacteriaceae bacterium]|nr:guanylate kinase [Bifidobacteriaceae bacterium]